MLLFFFSRIISYLEKKELTVVRSCFLIVGNMKLSFADSSAEVLEGSNLMSLSDSWAISREGWCRLAAEREGGDWKWQTNAHSHSHIANPHIYSLSVYLQFSMAYIVLLDIEGHHYFDAGNSLHDVTVTSVMVLGRFTFMSFYYSNVLH